MGGQGKESALADSTGQKLAEQASRSNSNQAATREFRLGDELPGFKALIFDYLAAMPLLHRFLDPSFVSLKICGVTRKNEAQELVALGVDALGFNFWPHSKRYLPEVEAAWLKELQGEILRVGVFVNQPIDFAIRLYQEGLIDAVQLHGDETPLTASILLEEEIPFIKALGVKAKSDLAKAVDFEASAILLDTHAPGVYGGTGEVFDWNVAMDFVSENPSLPVILAGGITPENAALAAASVRPAALDVASGAEISPGVKDFKKVAGFLSALKR